MAYTDNVIAVGRETRLFVALESTPGTQIDVDSCSLVLLAGAGQVQQQIRLIDDPQYRNTRSRLMPITGSYNPGSFSFPCLLKTKAASGVPTPAEIDVLLQCLFGKPSTASGYRSYTLKGVDPGGTVYPSFTAYFKEGHTVHYLVGATVNQAEIMIVGNDLVKITFSGEFMRHGWIGTSGGASIDQEKYFFADAADEGKVQTWDPSDGSFGAATTISTASPPSAPGGDLLLVPYLPAGTEIGNALYGKYGVATVNAAAQFVNQVRITISNGLKYLADIKDDTAYPTAYIAPGFREVRGEVQMFSFRNLPVYTYKSQQDPMVSDALIVPCTDRPHSAGRGLEVRLPKVVWETPTTSGEEEKSASIPFRAVASSSFNDEIELRFVETLS